MNKKALLRIIVLITLLYPSYMLFRAEEILVTSPIQNSEDGILSYQISVWISWVVLVSVAVFYKWTEKRNSFFSFVYGFIVVSFAVYGYLYQSFITSYELPSPFKDDYTLGVLMALQNIVIAGVLTGFLHAAVWWFTRRWHRRYT